MGEAGRRVSCDAAGVHHPLMDGRFSAETKEVILMPYVIGKALKLRHQNGEEQASLFLFGDQNAEGAGWAMDAATAQHPRQAVLSDC